MSKSENRAVLSFTTLDFAIIIILTALLGVLIGGSWMKYHIEQLYSLDLYVRSSPHTESSLRLVGSASNMLLSDHSSLSISHDADEDFI
jgi:hypothetical protein